MDQHTYKQLDERITNLEIQLDIHNEALTKSNNTVVVQLSQLQKKLNDFYNSNAELATLNKIINDLGIWDKINETPNAFSNITEIENNESGVENVSDVTIDMKEKMVLMKYPAIKEAYNNLIQLSNMDIPKLINYMDSSQEKTHNFNNDNYELLQKKQLIQDIINNFHLLVVKNMVMFEKYMKLMLRENKYWVVVDEQLQLLRTKIMTSEKRHMSESKY